MKRRIYADTSVIGGCLDDEFKIHSCRLFDGFTAGSDILVLSNITESELEGAPKAVRDLLAEVPPSSLEEITFTEEASTLAQQYISAGVIGPGKLTDAQHIAVATVHRVDVLVSWNFRHIVNLHRIQGFNSVNLRHGYPLLEIRTPQEVVTVEGEGVPTRESEDTGSREDQEAKNHEETEEVRRSTDDARDS